MAASAPGVLYHYPWDNWGNFKYLWYAPIAMGAWQGAKQGLPFVENLYVLMLVLVCLRYLMFQVWGTVSRLPSISHKHQIQTKGIKFEQVDHEANWESSLLVGTYLIWLAKSLLLPKKIPLWDSHGIFIAFFMHVGPIEWLYYWGHRALHHRTLFTRYHQHHHSSFVTQPITSNNHPFLEEVFYNLLFGLPLFAPLLMGHISIGLVFVYILFIDFLNAWGHCNFEFIPTWVFDTLPALKYFIYSPTYHSLHHSKVHTNFCLFMPLYDYIYGTIDATTDSLYQEVRKGHTTKVDCVYLTHMTEMLSTFHLQIGFQTFAAQPYSKKWYIWIMWPLALPLMILAWLFTKPFVGATHFIDNKLELQTWVIPRFNFQYSLRSEAAKIDGWIKECVIQAQLAGAKVIGLALLNKDREFHKSFMDKKDGKSIAIVTGDTLAAAIVAKEVEAKHKNTKEVFITSAHSRVGRAISTYLCERGFRVLALLPSKKDAENLRACISTKLQSNLVFTTKYDAGKSCKVWIVGEQIGRQLQGLAPRGTHFHQHAVFPMHKWRKDCTYGAVPGMKLSVPAQTINSCEDLMPRYVVRASYVAAMVHTLEGWCHNDLNDDISIELMDESWKSALKHGFYIVDEDINTNWS